MHVRTKNLISNYSFRRLSAALPAMAGFAFAGAHPALAAPATWDGNAAIGVPGDGTSWSSPDNWTTNGVVDSAPSNTAPGDDLTFGNGTVGQINLQANRVANSVSFNAGFTLSGNTSTLTLGTGNVTVAPSVSATINTQLAGANGLTKLGVGTLTLDDADVYSGATTVSAGQLIVDNPAAISGSLSVGSSGAVLFGSSAASASPMVNGGALSIAPGATVSFTSTSNSFTQSAGTLTVGGALLLYGNTFNYNGGAIAGTVTLNIDSSYDSPTLSLGSTSVSTGAFLFNGVFGTVSGGVVPSGVSVTLEPNPALFSGSYLSFSSTNVTNNGSINFIGAPSVTETTGVSGTLTNAGSMMFSGVGSPSSNPDYIGGTLNNTGALTVAATLDDQGALMTSGTINVTAGTLAVVNGQTFSQSAGVVNVAAGAALDLSLAYCDLSGGTIDLAPDATAPAHLNLYYLTYGGGTQPATIAALPVGAGQSPGDVNLNGKTVFFEVTHGSATNDVVISAPITNGAIELDGTGTLLLSGKNSFSSAIVTGGKLIAGAAGALPANLPVKLTGGELQLAPGSGSESFSSLAISAGATLDITNNHVLLNYGVGPDPIASIAALIATGYSGGSWSGAGITSSSAADNSASYGIGYADSADPGNPAGLVSGQIEIKYTLLGDANLDGKVNGTDFAILAANFNQGVTSWDQADFNYDHKVNGTDFAFVASNFNQGASQADIAALDAFADAHGLSLVADVPEPTAAGLILLSARAPLLRRRGRRGASAES